MRSAAIEGVVRTAHGVVVPGAEVVATQWLPRPGSFVSLQSCACKTDSSGRFALWGAPAAGGKVIVARAPGHESTTVTVKENDSSDLVIVLYQMRAVTGRVLGPLGTDLAGFIIAAIGEQGVLSRTWSGSDGAFSLDVPGKSQEVIVWRSGYSPRVIPLPADAEPSALLIDVEGALTIEGTVVDDQGQPVHGALVRVYSYAVCGGGMEKVYSSGLQLPDSRGEWALSPLGAGDSFAAPGVVSDLHGRFRIQAGAPAPHRTRLLAERDGHAPAVMTWEPGCSEGLVVLRRMAAIECEVRSSKSGGKVDAFTVEVQTKGDDYVVTREYSPSAERGQVLVTPGRHSVRVRAQGYRSSPREDVVVAPGEVRAVRAVLIPRD
jgi:hypothetical protein